MPQALQLSMRDPAEPAGPAFAGVMRHLHHHASKHPFQVDFPYLKTGAGCTLGGCMLIFLVADTLEAIPDPLQAKFLVEWIPYTATASGRWACVQRVRPDATSDAGLRRKHRQRLDARRRLGLPIDRLLAKTTEESSVSAMPRFPFLALDSLSQDTRFSLFLKRRTFDAKPETGPASSYGLGAGVPILF